MADRSSGDRVRIGIVGSGYIAGAHSAAYRTVAGTYPDVPRHVDLVACADVDAGRADELARAWGWSRSTTDWREITRADDIDVVDICVPNAFHAEVACDALAHGKHVICEKPLANSADGALDMVVAARDAGRIAQVCFYYRLWPAIAWAAELVASGELGPVRHFRGWMLQDYAADPAHDLGWRARLAESGAGALGDLGSHIIDIARHLCGEITAVSATTRELVERVNPTPGVDDLVSMFVDFGGATGTGTGAGGVIEASWALRGHKCDLGFDLVCERGAVRFSWERFNQIDVLTGDVADPMNGYRSVLIGGGQPDVGRFVAVPGQGMGYRDAFTIGVSRTLAAIVRGDTAASPSFADGMQVALTVEAAKQSAADRRWVSVPTVERVLEGR
jgi:predicted dehydrogenase